MSNQWLRSKFKDFVRICSHLNKSNGIADPRQAPTAEDIALSDNGLEFEFVPGEGIDPDATVKYIRFRSLEHFNSTQPPRILLAGISLWGTLVK